MGRASAYGCTWDPRLALRPALDPVDVSTPELVEAWERTRWQRLLAGTWQLVLLALLPGAGRRRAALTCAQARSYDRRPRHHFPGWARSSRHTEHIGTSRTVDEDGRSGQQVDARAGEQSSRTREAPLNVALLVVVLACLLVGMVMAGVVGPLAGGAFARSRSESSGMT